MLSVMQTKEKFHHLAFRMLITVYCQYNKGGIIQVTQSLDGILEKISVCSAFNSIPPAHYQYQGFQNGISMVTQFCNFPLPLLT